jgi:hypothetical protein
MIVLPRPAPYPGDTLARGYRFELDTARVTRSDTWALASPLERPWLLMLWMVAWDQSPVASLPSEDRLIAARLGMPVDVFAAARDTLMRGWWLADDGRLYHDTLVERVLEMLHRRAKDTERTARWRALRDAKQRGGAPESQGGDGGVTRDTHVSPGFATREFATGTGTGRNTGTVTREKRARAPESGEHEGADVGDHQPTQAGLVCRSMRKLGVQDVNPGDPRLLALLKQGATAEEFAGVAADAARKGKGFAWALVALVNRRQEAAALTLAPKASDPVEAQAEATVRNTSALLDTLSNKLTSPPPQALRDRLARKKAAREQGDEPAAG